MKTKIIIPLLAATTFTIVFLGCQKKPEAGFETTSVNSDGDNELTVYKKISFQNLTTDGVSYEWDFGDGNNSSNENPEHMYANPGKYSVVLKAYSKNGKRESTSTKEIAVNRWNISSFEYTFGASPIYWGDSTGCFEAACDTLNGKIIIYAGTDTVPVYTSPMMYMGANSTNKASVTMPSLLSFTNESWRIAFVHVYSSGAGKKFAEYTFNPVLTPTNGIVNNKHEHYIGFSKGGVSITLSFYFDKAAQ